MIKINPQINSVRAFAPATCANIAVGFDLLGFSFPCISDEIMLEKRQDNQIQLQIDAEENLPTDANKNVASATIIHALKQLNLSLGLDIHLKKGIPLGSGMGGSAASTVAALTALNGFLEPKLSLNDIASLALFGEALATGTEHPDNIVPCIFGGLTLTTKLKPLTVIELPTPALFSAIVHPDLRLDTRESRKALIKPFELQAIVKQTANLSGFIAGVYRNDMELISNSLTDELIEPRRAALIPHFHAVQQTALDHGAIAASISGSGPSMFALSTDANKINAIANAMQQVFLEHDIQAQVWTHAICKDKAMLTHINQQELSLS